MGLGSPGAGAPGSTASRRGASHELSPLTANAELDHALVSYSSGQSATTTNGVLVPVESFRDPQRALAQCSASAHHFAEFLCGLGIDAWVDRWDESRGPPSKEYGYEDRPLVDGYEERHFLTLIEHESETYTVDWTAAQFGYQEFPLVQRERADGTWERAALSPDAPG
jgi:hypothetical protein